MNCSDYFREIAFQLVNVSNSLINVLLDFLNDLFQLLIIDWEIVLKDSNGLLAGLNKDD